MVFCISLLGLLLWAVADDCLQQNLSQNHLHLVAGAVLRDTLERSGERREEKEGEEKRI